VSKIAALTVQTATRPTTGQASAPGQLKKAENGTAPVSAPVAAPVTVTVAAPIAPVTAVVATPTLAALIEVQAKGDGNGKGHTDPQPTHGNDDQHGHKPADPPPVVTPPVVTPPPVAVPPRPVAVDPNAAARSLAMLSQTLSERDAIRAAGAAFVAAAAEREAFQAINQNQAATSLLQGLQGAMQAFNATFDGNWSRRSLYA
jgi:hypothetical protein